jgi:HD-GYP domain-containing protein (c-di-GMP phosphodiesterase class II)
MSSTPAPGEKKRKKSTARLLNLIGILSNLDAFPERPQLYYHEFLTTLLNLIPEAEYGSVAILTGELWEITAIVGHDSFNLLGHQTSIDLGCFENVEPQCGPNFLFTAASRLDDSTRELFHSARKATAQSLGGTFVINTKNKIHIVLDIEKGGPKNFSKESVALFSGLLKLAGSYQKMIFDNSELERRHRQIQDRQKKIETLTVKLNRLLTLTSRLGEHSLEANTFFEELLETSLLVVDEADYGSISLIHKGTWKFLATKGHDFEKLNRLSLRAEWLYRTNDMVSVVDIMAQSHQKIPEDTYQLFYEYTLPIRSSLVINFDLYDEYSISMSLDISKGNLKDFSEMSKEILRRFSKIAASFFKIKFNSDVLENAYIAFSNRLALAAESHDPSVAVHNHRVAEISRKIAEKMGLAQEMVHKIHRFAGLHDIGKLFIPTEILLKSTVLDEAEIEVLRSHPARALDLLSDPYFEVARNIAYCHHERYDGSGYPRGLVGDAIPLEAQIVSLADVFDAIRSERSYKRAYTLKETLDIFRQGDSRTRPEEFNPKLLLVLLENAQEIESSFYA